MPLVSYDADGGVATIRMDDGKANALSSAMIGELNGALDRAAQDQAVVLLTGRSGVFSGGFDLKVMSAGGPAVASLVEEGFLLAMRLLAFPAPVVIACTGHAVAMGSFLTLSADYRIGLRGPFRVVANEVSIGMIVPWTAIEFCRHRLNTPYFERVVNLSEVFTPDGALAAGFFDELVDEDELTTRARDVCARFVQLDRSAHTATKSRSRESAIAAIEAAFRVDHEFLSGLVR